MINTPLLKETKRIAFIGQKGIPAEFVGTSGVEFYVEIRALQLNLQKKIVDCYVRNWATPKNMFEYKNIRLIHIPTINTKYLDATIHSFLSSVYVSFTHTDTVWYQAIGPASFSFIPKLFGKKIIVTIHALDWKREKWNRITKILLHIAEIIAVKTADNLVVVSSELFEYYKNIYPKNIYIDPPITKKIRFLTPDIITSKYGLKGNDFILFMGRFVPEKRIDWLIDAYKQINPKKIKLVLAGGSSHSDEYVKKLYASSNNTNIIFTGYVFGKEKDELLSNCKLFVLPSSTEGNSTIIHELLNKTTCLINKSVFFTRKKVLACYFFESKNDLLHQLKQILDN